MVYLLIYVLLILHEHDLGVPFYLPLESGLELVYGRKTWTRITCQTGKKIENVVEDLKLEGLEGLLLVPSPLATDNTTVEGCLYKGT